MKVRKVTTAALLALAALAPVACGGGGDDSATKSTVDADLKSAIGTDVGKATTTSEGATTTAAVKEPTTMEEWEALWKTQRDATVAKIKANGWGLQADGKTVLGPEGMKVDLNKCTAGWNNTEGLTDTTIKMGSTGPASGTAADGININKAITVILDYYGNKGLFTDSLGKTRKVNQLIKDDGYDPARTIPLVDELMDSEKAFNISTQGSANALKTYDKLNQRCIPHFFNSTGHPAWGDPINHPWTSGMLLSYNIEALLWGSFIDQHISEFPAGKVVIAALVMNNDFGKIYDQSLKAYIAQSPNKDRLEYVTEYFEPQAALVTDQMTTLASKNPAVFIMMETGTPCAQTITEADHNGMNAKTKYRFVSSVCKNTAYVGKAAVGEASNGWWIVGGGFRDLTSPGEDGNAYVVWARDLLKQAGYDYKSSGYLGFGLAFGWSYAQLFATAGQLPGGLTRANVLTVARTLDMTPAAYLSGIKANMNGNKDAYWIEGSELATYDSAKQQWVTQGAVIDLSGKSKLCAWNQSTSSCG